MILELQDAMSIADGGTIEWREAAAHQRLLN
jgi:hypothetical protein